MIVRCKANNGLLLKEKTIEAGYSQMSEFSLNIGSDYIVYGLIIWNGVIQYLTMDKHMSVPFWHPAELFEIINKAIPYDWYFDSLEETGVQLICGYKELVEDENHFDDLLERKEEAINIFLKRKKEIDAQ
jgi:hypothetical protein